MVSYNESEYSNLRAQFKRELDRVEPYKTRRELTKSLNKREDYKESLIRTFNNIVNFFSTALRSAQLEDRLEIQSIVVEHLAKLKEAFCILRLKYEFARVIYEPIDINKVDQDWTDLDGSTNDNEDDNKSTDSTSPDKILDSNTTDTNKQKLGETSQTQGDRTTNLTINNSVQATNSQSNGQINQINMTQSAEEFMALAHRTINYKYNGDPLALDSFIDAITLLTSLCKPQNKTICIQFIMTKLEGEAREAIETEPQETKDIMDALKAHIKTESSKVIEGRILALRADKTNLTTFSQRAEDLAEQYRRSLCKEGYSKAKAKELAIEKTVDLCRRSARNDQVKSIIAATAFTDPKEVIAKMIVEINNVKLDRSVTQKHNNYNNKNSNNKSYKSNYGNNNNRQQNNSRGSGSSNSQNFSNSRQNNGNGNGYRGNRSNYNNSNNGNGRTFYNSNNSNNSRRQNEQSLRYYSGNETNPSSGGQTPDTHQ